MSLYAWETLDGPPRPAKQRVTMETAKGVRKQIFRSKCIPTLPEEFVEICTTNGENAEKFVLSTLLSFDKL